MMQICLVTTLTLGAMSLGAIAETPIASWTFDDDNENFVIHDAEFVAGRDDKGRALRFDGVKSCVDCGADEKWHLAREFTIEAVIKPTAPRLHNMTIVAKGYRYAGRYNLRTGIPWDRSKLIFEVGAHQTHEIPIPFDEWAEIAAVCDGQRVATFLNGKLLSVRPFGGGFKTNDTPLTIGKAIGAPDGGEFFEGLIDEVRLYDVALPKYKLEGATGADINRGNPACTTNERTISSPVPSCHLTCVGWRPWTT